MALDDLAFLINKDSCSLPRSQSRWSPFYYWTQTRSPPQGLSTCCCPPSSWSAHDWPRFIIQVSLNAPSWERPPLATRSDEESSSPQSLLHYTLFLSSQQLSAVGRCQLWEGTDLSALLLQKVLGLGGCSRNVCWLKKLQNKKKKSLGAVLAQDWG